MVSGENMKTRKKSAEEKSAEMHAAVQWKKQWETLYIYRMSFLISFFLTL
jgi:hypothetical protein